MQELIEKRFNKLRKDVFYYGNIELVRFMIFELDRVRQDLIRVDYELRMCGEDVDKSRFFR